MNPSSALCRAQEALQRGRASDTTLTNVRTIAEKAAAAWNIEAIAAERRERRHDRTSLIAARLLEEKRLSRQQGDRSLSENPDRGFANI